MGKHVGDYNATSERLAMLAEHARQITTQRIQEIHMGELIDPGGVPRWKREGMVAPPNFRRLKSVADPTLPPVRPRDEERIAVAARFKEVFGMVPDNLQLILRAMTHPEIVGSVRALITGVTDEDLPCSVYADPWDCEKETEAKWETIHWGLNDTDLRFDEAWKNGWCDNCKERVQIV